MGCITSIYNFLTGITVERQGAETPTLEELYNKAFELAWRDMATHTLSFSSEYSGDTTEKRKARKAFIDKLGKELHKDIRSLYKSESSETFDTNHEKLCKDIVNGKKQFYCNNSHTSIKSSVHYIDNKNFENEGLTYGQSQKLVNMVIKYMYVYDKLYGYNELNNESWYHIPIDNRVIEAIWDGWNKNNFNHIKDSIPPNKVRVKNQIRPWSQWTKKDYLDFHKAYCEEKALSPSPFLWELKNWPFKKYKKS